MLFIEAFEGETTINIESLLIPHPLFLKEGQIYNLNFFTISKSLL